MNIDMDEMSVEQYTEEVSRITELLEAIGQSAQLGEFVFVMDPQPGVFFSATASSSLYH